MLTISKCQGSDFLLLQGFVLVCILKFFSIQYTNCQIRGAEAPPPLPPYFSATEGWADSCGNYYSYIAVCSINCSEALLDHTSTATHTFIHNLEASSYSLISKLWDNNKVGLFKGEDYTHKKQFQFCPVCDQLLEKTLKQKKYHSHS